LKKINKPQYKIIKAIMYRLSVVDLLKYLNPTLRLVKTLILTAKSPYGLYLWHF